MFQREGLSVLRSEVYGEAQVVSLSQSVSQVSVRSSVVYQDASWTNVEAACEMFQRPLYCAHIRQKKQRKMSDKVLKNHGQSCSYRVEGKEDFFTELNLLLFPLQPFFLQIQKMHYKNCGKGWLYNDKYTVQDSRMSLTNSGIWLESH